MKSSGTRLISQPAEMNSWQRRARIASVEEQLKSTNDTLRRLELMDKLYDEYYTFRFDSTMICLDQMQQLADASGSKYYQQLTSIHGWWNFLRRGFYLETKELIDKIDTASLDPRLKYKYYESMFWAYIIWKSMLRANGI